MRLPVMQERLSKLTEKAGNKLDGMENMLPQPKPRIPFVDYVQRARQVAARDPQFRAAFEQALRQRQAVEGVSDANSLRSR